MLLDDQRVQEGVARVEALLGDIENLSDPVARAKTAEVVQVLLELYGEGLARMMDTVAEGEDRERTFGAFAGDELVSHLLLLHGLHPLDLESRVLGALDEVRPYLESHGGNVELLGLENGIARLRLGGSCDGCPSSTVTLKLAIEEAIQKAAPDLEGIEAEGVAEPEPAPNLVAGPTLGRKPKKKSEPVENGARWTMVGGLPQLSGGGLLAKEISGEPVLFIKLDADFFAYRNVCPGCSGPLEDGVLDGSGLECAGCGVQYDVRRAGKSLDDSRLQAEPIPLLVGEEGLVKIAHPGAVDAVI